MFNGSNFVRMLQGMLRGVPAAHSAPKRVRVGSDTGVHTQFSQCKYFAASAPEINRRIKSARQHNKNLSELTDMRIVSRKGNVLDLVQYRAYVPE